MQISFDFNVIMRWESKTLLAYLNRRQRSQRNCQAEPKADPLRHPRSDCRPNHIYIIVVFIYLPLDFL